ncbi:methylated-DNA--[protein]-cysteine S-methyltransferase [Bacillus sp. 03113]|uniref:methylated-DNA--[protein]-cysteine S-methyltransferase n=1 Tax=Bacillus sp. 03113 TaxID=2578211 RepID=UPI0011432CC0|nr:methylated-DNA--[protein]-cysteine S-methyltransferase [Bacillus sp. 03113]
MEQINHQTIYWSLFNHENWQFYIAATSKGLCYVGSPNSPFVELSGWVTKKCPNDVLVHNDEELKPYIDEFNEYFEGKRNQFNMSVDLRGTEFQQSIWSALYDIPYGKTNSYSQIAERIQKPQAVRAVGAAIGANPVLITVPCHRVIAKNGALTGFRGGLEMKEFLLDLEKGNALKKEG